MSNIKIRLSELEAAIKSKNKIPVLIVDENYNGTYSVNGKTFTEEQLNKLCIDLGVETLIVDDLGSEVQAENEIKTGGEKRE